MNRDQVLKECYDKFENGFFNVNECPVKSTGNCLEMTGKLLLAMTIEEKTKNKDLIKLIYYGLKQNNIIGYGEALYPRTVYYGTDNPNYQESKNDLWENIHHGFWARTDVSHSQLTYLLQGTMGLNTLSYLRENKWVIKRHDGKPAQNGNFNIPLPNIQLRKYFAKEILGLKHNLIEKIWYKVMQYLKPKGSDGLNTILIYYSICKIKGFNKRIKTMILDYINNYMNNLPVGEFKYKITWLLLDKIKKELRS